MSPSEKLWLSLFVALPCLLVIAVWSIVLLDARRRRCSYYRGWLILGGVTVVAICFGLVLHGVFVIRFDRQGAQTRHQEREAFRDAAQPCLDWLSQYHAEHGTYPDALPKDLNNRLWAVESRSWYHPRPDRKTCSLGYGNYATDGYVYYWSSDAGI